jgi:hypothetical protein
MRLLSLRICPPAMQATLSGRSSCLLVQHHSRALVRGWCQACRASHCAPSGRALATKEAAVRAGEAQEYDNNVELEPGASFSNLFVFNLGQYHVATKFNSMSPCSHPTSSTAHAIRVLAACGQYMLVLHSCRRSNFKGSAHNLNSRPIYFISTPTLRGLIRYKGVDARI